jgi:hypothetical protein
MQMSHYKHTSGKVRVLACNETLKVLSYLELSCCKGQRAKFSHTHTRARTRRERARTQANVSITLLRTRTKHMNLEDNERVAKFPTSEHIGMRTLVFAVGGLHTYVTKTQPTETDEKKKELFSQL